MESLTFPGSHQEKNPIKLHYEVNVLIVSTSFSSAKPDHVIWPAILTHNPRPYLQFQREELKVLQHLSALG